MIHRCAWCGRVRSGTTWGMPVAPLDRRVVEVTDGICPACAARYEAELDAQAAELAAHAEAVIVDKAHGER
ncbi:MAG: hypothetical protein WC683_02030 [bacterium]